MKTVYLCCSVALENDFLLTDEQREAVKEMREQIAEAIPSLSEQRSDSTS